MAENLILTPKEVAAVQMALNSMIGDFEAVGKDPTLPFNPEARREMKDILETAKSALEKIVKTSGHDVGLAPYNEGDEKEFFTKES
jgi:hypothetical protein